MSKLGTYFVELVVDKVVEQVDRDLKAQHAQLSQSQKEDLIAIRLDRITQFLIEAALDDEWYARQRSGKRQCGDAGLGVG